MKKPLREVSISVGTVVGECWRQCSELRGLPAQCGSDSMYNARCSRTFSGGDRGKRLETAIPLLLQHLRSTEKMTAATGTCYWAGEYHVRRPLKRIIIPVLVVVFQIEPGYACKASRVVPFCQGTFSVRPRRYLPSVWGVMS